MISRPVLQGAAPYGLLGDQTLVPPVAGQSARKASNAYDSFEWFNALDVAALPSNGLDVLLYQDATVPGGNTISAANSGTFASTYSIAANFPKANDLIRIRGRGVFGITALSPTLRIRVLVGGVVMLAQTATALAAGALTNAGWEIEADLFVTAIGGAATWEAQGKLVLGNVSSGAAAGTPAGAKGADIYMLANVGTITRATNVANPITIDVQWGTAAGANTITLRQMTVEILRQ